MGRITLDKVTKSFGDVNVIPPLDLTINDGEFVVFVGPSGCGKSTLLRLIAGLEDVTSGQIRIDGEDATNLPPAKRKLAMVFQSYALYPHMSVRKNIAFPMKMAGVDEAEQKKRIEAAAKALNLTDYLDRRPGQLSGGQRQRVAIGRAIVREPSAFLFDEPLSNLDAALRVNMRLEISELHNQLETTMIYVTHDQVEAMTLADKIVVLKDGMVMQSGAPMELYHEPANLFVAGFLGAPSMNFLKVTVEDMGEDWVQVSSSVLSSVKVPSKGRPFTNGQTATLGIRPQYLSTAAEGEGMLKGKVVLTERLGSETVVNLAVSNGSTLIAAIAEDAVLVPGNEMSWTFDPALVHAFPESM